MLSEHSHLLQILWLYFYDDGDFVNNFIHVAQKLAPWSPKVFFLLSATDERLKSSGTRIQVSPLRHLFVSVKP